MTENNKKILESLVGEFTKPQLANLEENLEFYFNPDISVFVPIYRYCDYAASPNHSHPAYSFIYSINQMGQLLLNGKPKNNPLNSSSFICAFSPGIVHQEIIEEGTSNYIAVFIRKEYFENALMAYGNRGELILEGDFFPVNDNLLYLLKLLMLEYNTNGHNHSHVIDSLNQLITHQFIRVFLQQDITSASINTSNKIDLAIAYIHKNISEKLTVNNIAKEVNISSSHFAKLFKDYTNKTPIEFITKIRIEKAKRLLKLSDKNLTEIAFDCGFSSSSYFSHTFIESVQLTPSEYRKKFTIQENIDKNT